MRRSGGRTASMSWVKSRWMTHFESLSSATYEKSSPPAQYSVMRKLATMSSYCEE